MTLEKVDCCSHPKEWELICRKFTQATFPKLTFSGTIAADVTSQEQLLKLQHFKNNN